MPQLPRINPDTLPDVVDVSDNSTGLAGVTGTGLSILKHRV
jgi:hypothetical protein